MTNSIRIHYFARSGHAHRAELFASLIGIAHELIDVDLAGGEHRREPFLSLNSSGTVPVIEDGATVVSDSNAILVYLARKYAPDWLPKDPALEAEVQKFLTFAAGDIAHGPAAARLVTVFGATLDADKAIALAHKAFIWLEGHLDSRTWLVGESPTIADVAVYSYTAHAPEGNVSLEAYPNIRRWLSTVEALTGFVAMPGTKAGLLAE